jgi:hypothetical protein
MTLPHNSPLPSERPSFEADVVRIGVLGLIALILGSMLAYDLVRPQSTSASAPFPRPRPSASDAPAVHAADPTQSLPSTSGPAPSNPRG